MRASDKNHHLKTENSNTQGIYKGWELEKQDGVDQEETGGKPLEESKGGRFLDQRNKSKRKAKEKM